MIDINYVYLIAHRDGDGGYAAPIKIGFTKHPEKRLAALQTGNPQPLGIVFKLKAPSPELARLSETAFHQVAAEHRLGGEWFDMTPEFGLNTLVKCFLAMIASDISDPDELRIALEWCDIPAAAALWQSMAEEPA